MPKLSFGLKTRLAPERVISMLTDFSPRRPELWPTLAAELYEVYQVEPNSADVQEGSTFPARIWERDHYEWTADLVRWTVRESNYCLPGSYVQVTVLPSPDGGSHVRVEWSRDGIGWKGKLLIGLVVLTGGANIREKVFERAFTRMTP